MAITININCPANCGEIIPVEVAIDVHGTVAPRGGSPWDGRASEWHVDTDEQYECECGWVGTGADLQRIVDKAPNEQYNKWNTAVDIRATEEYHEYMTYRGG